MSNKPIFLDSHSTTPCDPRIIKIVKPYFSNYFYNSSSAHFGGEIVKEAIELAREQVASIIKAKSENIFFTSSATEANNLIIKSAFFNHIPDEDGYSYILTTNVEHSSVKESIKWLKKFPTFRLLYIKVKKDGTINLYEIENIIKKYKKNIALISIIGAQNEIGTIYPLKKIGKLCKKYNILFNSDLTQLVGKKNINVDKYNLFSASFSSHKIYGMKGCGALFVRNVKMIKNLIHGGNQETITSGTLNTISIVSFGKACEILEREGSKENKRIAKLRDLLWELLSNGLTDIYINGVIGKNRITNNLNITIKGIDAEAIVKGSNIYCSAGSACLSGSLEPSPVQIAIGNPFPKSAIRFGLHRFTTKQEIIQAAKQIIEIVEDIREK